MATTREAPTPPQRTCACRSTDARECTRLRYGHYFLDDSDDYDDDDPCACHCHEDYREWLDDDEY